MKYLVLIRHGDYDNSGHLSNSGRESIKLATDDLKSRFPQETFAVLTSTANRARESAEIISASLGVEVKEYDMLFSDDFNTPKLQETLELVQSNANSDVVILVTHYEYTDQFPRYFGKTVWGKTLHSTHIDKGEGIVIDCNKQKTIAVI